MWTLVAVLWAVTLATLAVTLGMHMPVILVLWLYRRGGRPGLVFGTAPGCRGCGSTDWDSRIGNEAAAIEHVVMRVGCTFSRRNGNRTIMGHVSLAGWDVLCGHMLP